MNNTKTIKNSKNKRNSIISMLLIFVLVIVGIFAFLTAQDTKTNTFTIGNVDIQLKEIFDGTLYDKTTGEPIPIEKVLPIQTTEKTPWINNDGSNAANVFMRVGIPIIDAVLQDKDGNELNDGNIVEVEAFKLLDKDGNEGINEGWTLVATYEGRSSDDEHDNTKYNYYVYAYNEVLEPEADTEPLFNSVQMVNHTTNRGEPVVSGDGQTTGNIMPSELKIPINAYAIQKGLADGDTQEIWDNYIVGKIFEEPPIFSTASKDDDEIVIEEPSVTFYGYLPGGEAESEEDIVFEPITLTWSEIVAGKDAEKYNYGSTAATMAINRELDNVNYDIEETRRNMAYYENELANGNDQPWVTEALNNYETELARHMQRKEKLEEFINNPQPISDTYIPPYAFSETLITSIILPDTIEKIDDYAFYNAFLLTKISLPDTLTDIGAGAFQYDEWLTEVNIPTSLTTISENLFDGCTSIKSIVIPDGITEIGAEAFMNCQEVNEVVIPDTVTFIGHGAFAYINCPISVPNNVTTIEKDEKGKDGDTFDGCPNLICSSKITNLDGYPWGANCVNGYEKDGIVYDSPSMTRVMAVSNAVPSEVTLPDSVTSIHKNAFDNFDGHIDILTLSDKIDEIEKTWMFEDVDLLIYHGSASSDNNWSANSLNGYVDDDGYVYKDSSCKELEAYIGDPLSGDIIVPDGVEIIGKNAFGPEDLMDITSIFIPNSVKIMDMCSFHIENFYFYDNDNNSFRSPAINITLSDNLQKIDYSAFSGVKPGSIYYLNNEYNENNIYSALNANGVKNTYNGDVHCIFDK